MQNFLQCFDTFTNIIMGFINRLSKTENFIGFPDTTFPVYNSKDVGVMLSFENENITISAHSEKVTIQFEKDNCSYEDPFSETVSLAAVICENWDEIEANIHKEISDIRKHINESLKPFEKEMLIIENFIKPNSDKEAKA